MSFALMGADRFIVSLLLVELGEARLKR